MTIQQNCWSLHLYYAEPWDQFLIDAVKPLTDRLLAAGSIDKYFFIRYWKNGPHIRLRLFGDEWPVQAEEFLSNYMKANPSARQDPEWLKEDNADQMWYPNNSIQEIAYKPELERYGGAVMTQIAEKLFQYSSESVLQVMKDEIDDWGYDRAMGAAIQTHLAMAAGLGMDLAEASAFYTRYFENWLIRAYYFYGADVSKADMEKRKESAIASFNDQFSLQKDLIIPMVADIWELMENQVAFEEQWLQKWFLGVKEIHKELQNHLDGDWQLHDHFLRFEPNNSFPITNQKRWCLYESYMHMSNNRLGIFNHDEAFLAFLLKESLKVMGPNSIHRDQNG